MLRAHAGIMSHLLQRRRGAGTPARRVDTRVDPLARTPPERRHECPRHVLSKLIAGLLLTLCAWGQGDGSTPLHWAVYNDELPNAEALLRAGADAKAVTKYGVTPLSLACTNGNAAMIELLLKAGADANATLPGGETALMTAARTGNPDAVLALIRHGANVNAKEPGRGQTALMWAAAEGHAAAVKVLLENGAHMHARS